MNTFIDTLGRLTAEQAELIHEAARLHDIEQRRVADAEMDRLHEEFKQEAAELKKRENAVRQRQETLNMAWLGAEFLKAAKVPIQNWVDIAPNYETRGFFRQRQELVGRKTLFVFDGWKLETLKEKKTVQTDFYSAERTELILTEAGAIGIAKSRQYIDGEPKSYVDYRLSSMRGDVTIRRRPRSFGFRDNLTDEERAKLEADYQSQDELHEDNTLDLLNLDCTGRPEELANMAYSARHLQPLDERFRKLSAPLDWFPSINLGPRIEEALYTAVGKLHENMTDKAMETFSIDVHMRIALARLLALNDIKVI